MKAVILTIGDEILIGDTVDTNSAWIGSQLNSIGVDVRKTISVGDRKNEIVTGLNEGLESGDLVLITGGLGPTKDDITKKTIADYFQVGFKRVPSIENKLRAYYESRKREFLPIHAAMADIPENAIVLNNRIGTAPGMWFEFQGKVIISMPGVPYEMKAIVTDEVIPRLKSSFELPVIRHRYFLAAGKGETFLAGKIADIEESLPLGFSLAYLPGMGKVKVRLTGRGFEETSVQSSLKTIGDQIKVRLEKYIYGEDGAELVLVVGNLLKKTKKTLGTAESCTGGNVAHHITSFSGSSSYYNGSIVSYSNELKQKLLGVQETTLKEHGAVSERTVREMVTGARERLGVDYAIATSGIAGPSGGSDEKPVGTVWIAVGNKEHTVAKRFNFAKDRKINIELSAIVALEMLRRFMLGTLTLDN